MGLIRVVHVLLTLVTLAPATLFASTILLVPASPNQQTTSNYNDAYSTGRGDVFRADSSYTLSSVGLREDLSNVSVTYLVEQVFAAQPLSDSGAVVLSTGTQSFTSTGGVYNTFTFTPVTLLAGNYYEIEFFFSGSATTNYFYNNNNVPFTVAPFSQIDGTAGGSYINYVMPEIELNAMTAVTPEPSSLVLVGTGALSLLTMVRRRRCA